MRVVAQILGMVFYPLLVHLLIKLDMPWVAVTGLVITSAIYVFLVVNMQRRTGAHSGWVALYLFLTAAGSESLRRECLCPFVPSVIITWCSAPVRHVAARVGRTDRRVVRAPEFGGNLPRRGRACAPRHVRLGRVFQRHRPAFAWSLAGAARGLVAGGECVELCLCDHAALRPVPVPVFAPARYGVRMPWHTLRDGALPWPGRAAGRRRGSRNDTIPFLRPGQPGDAVAWRTARR